MLNEKEEYKADKSDFTNQELLDTLAQLQGELEGRDIVIATLQCEQRYLDIEDAKHNRYFLERGFDIDDGNALLALQRDERLFKNSENPDISTKIFTAGSKKYQLDELLDAQKHVQELLQEQIQVAEQRYITLCENFDEERKNLERDAAQSDDVVAMLEKERERLQFELEHERTQNRRLEKDLRKAVDSYTEQLEISQKQRIAAAHLIKDRRRLLRELSMKCQQVERYERQLGISSNSPKELSALSVSGDKTALQATAKTTVLQIDTSTNDHLPGNRKSISPPQQDSIGSLSSASTPSKPETTGASSTVSSHPVRVNGCSPSSPVDNVTSYNEMNSTKSPPLVKPRPEPPVRRTPEYTSPPTTRSSLSPRGSNRTPSSTLVGKLSALGVLEVETDSTAPVENPASTPSPPPPPPPMQLQYPYPGMQGNTHHPPVQNLASPRTRQTIAGHHFPGSPTNRGWLPTTNFVLSTAMVKNPPSNLRFVVDRNAAFGAQKTSLLSTTPSQLHRAPQGIMTSAPSFSVSSTPARSQGPRVMMVGRGGHLYINGK